jgi:hypothetical protein
VLLPTAITSLACLGVALSIVLVRRMHRSQRQQVHGASRLLAPAIVRGEQLPLVAVEAMEDFGRGPVLQVLRSARRQLRGPRATVLSDTLDALGETDRLEQALHSGLPRRRLAALWGLGECGGERAREILLQALDDRDARTRRVAREALALFDDDECARRALRSWLAEPSSCLERDGRFLRWLAVRCPRVLAEVDSLGIRIGGAHREALERVLSTARELVTRSGGTTHVLQSLLDPEEPSGELSVAGATARSDGLGEQDWLDERGMRLAGVFVHSTLGTEFALGLTLLAATFLGGFLAWLLY